jgi:hypothetical protein
MRAPVKVDAETVPTGELAQLLHGLEGWTQPPAKLWVFSTDTQLVRTRNGPRSGRYQGVDGSPRRRCPRAMRPGAHRDPVDEPVGTELRTSDVGTGLTQHFGARLDERSHGEEVRHGPGDREKSRLEPEQCGDALLELPDGRVLPVHVITDIGRHHRPPHRVGRET